MALFVGIGAIGDSRREEQQPPGGQWPPNLHLRSRGLLVGVTWSTENKPITDKQGNHPEKQTVPGGGQMVPRLPALSPEVSMEMLNKTRVCCQQDSCPPPPPGSEVRTSLGGGEMG